MTIAWKDMSPSELAQMIAAERAGKPFLAFRDVDTAMQLLELEGDRVLLGRDDANDLVLSWDAEVSRVHALLERLASAWTVIDEELSRNGTFVNGDRLHGRRRLEDRDILRLGRTEVLYRDPVAGAGETPHVSTRAGVVGITPGQRRVLVALCRPFLATSEPGATPPSNSELAQSLGVSTEAVRSQLKSLFRLFEIPDLPQNRKRAELARRALATGVVGPRDLTDDR